MTSEHASFTEVSAKLLPLEQYHPFPKYEEREAWESLPQNIREYYLGFADEILSYKILSIPATAYMEYAKTTRAPVYYEHLSQRRSMFVKAVLAECMEGKGRFIDKIIDLIWAICEESTWIEPGHNNHMHNYMWSGVFKNVLPDVTDFNFVDLVTAYTAAPLALGYYLLKKPLDEQTPLIRKRIELEMLKRVVIPFMNHDDMTWFGFYGHKINNWNPWIVCNIIPVGLITIKDPDLRAEFIARCMEKLDIYIKELPADGGCDEGPGYWGAAGGPLFDCFEELYTASEGKLNFFEEPLLKKFGEYITKAYFKNGSFANFADNTHYQHPDAIRLYRYGSKVGSDLMVAFAQSNLENTSLTDAGHATYAYFYCGLRNLFTAEEVCHAPKKEFVPQDAWFPDTALFYIRDCKDGLEAAAKGGFNNESHNHNDLGHFICAYEGEQFLVDIGRPPYTAKTFSPYRYEIWIVQSAYHNCAAINGFDQHDGDNFRAENLSASLDEKQGAYSVELKGAYEEKAGIESYIRSFAMDKVNSVWTVTDCLTLKEESQNVDFHYITVCEPKLQENCFTLELKNGHTAKVEFDAAKYAFHVDTKDLETDARKKEWQSEVAYRIHLTPKTASKNFQNTIKVTVD